MATLLISKFLEAMRYPPDDNSFFPIDIIDYLVHAYLEDLNEDALEIALTNGMQTQKSRGRIEPYPRPARRHRCRAPL